MASSSSKRRKGKEPMEQPPFDAGRFKTAFHELQYERIKNKKILPELTFQFNKDECPKIREMIAQRGWQKLTNLETKINANLIKEFYVNAVREDSTRAPTFKSYVRGTEVDFIPNAITRTLQLKSPHFDELSYQVRISNAPEEDELEEIVNDMCVIGSDWKRYSDKRPRFIRRGDLIPEAKGWFELVRRSILPAANNSEVNIARATMEAIGYMASSYMEGKEQQLHVQAQRMDHQEKLLSSWMDQQREWQKQQMELQQEHYSQLTQAINQVSERQESQDKRLQELNQCHIAQMKAFNGFSVLNEGRQLH
ncbi:hypothetical protein Ahy_A09g044944 [Arachis hypogaea]|uniref:Putative plant transposon protein domain-containing protein n=1 Tax=Arachis hypogaea TaxID=3818 RepID=A0A445BL68_ARAHY|nr:hypothetical protein Ahy_A09g044944 [Arachis hypogaea]